MSRADLKKALEDYYNSSVLIYGITSAAEEVLSTKVKNYRGKKSTVISKIAREENFNAEETIALCAGIQKFDVETVITAIKNQDYEFHVDASDYEGLGEVLRDQLIDDGIIPQWFELFVDISKLGWDHVLKANEYVFSKYGYFEIF